MTNTLQETAPRRMVERGQVKMGILHRGVAYFLYSVAGLLAITAMLKIVSAIVGSRYMGLNDPLFWFMSNKAMAVAAAGLELLVASSLLFSKWTKASKSALVAWLGALFLAYRCGLWFLGYSGPCPCLGGPLDWARVTTHQANSIAEALVAYMLLFGLLSCWLSTSPFRNQRART